MSKSSSSSLSKIDALGPVSLVVVAVVVIVFGVSDACWLIGISMDFLVTTSNPNGSEDKARGSSSTTFSIVAFGLFGLGSIAVAVVLRLDGGRFFRPDTCIRSFKKIQIHY